MEFDVLQCNYRHNPVIRGTDIVLTWNYRADCLRDVRQVSFRIDFAADEGFVEMVRTGTEIESEVMQFALPADVALKPSTVYFWRITSRDSAGRVAVSPIQSFEMALSDHAVWADLGAQWITCGSDKSLEPAAPIFYLDVNLPEPATFARSYVFGLGWQHLTVNGQSCVPWLLAPPNTHYDRQCLYETYPITDYLIRGNNRLELALGNGYNANYSQWGWRWFGPKVLKAIILIRCGSQTLYRVTDGNWRYRTGSIQDCDIYNGETYDAARSDFQDAPAWVVPAEAEPDLAPQGEMLANEMPPITVYREMEPIACWRSGADMIYDFGTNSAGFVRIKVRAPRGHALSLQFSELIAKDGTLAPITNRLAQAKDRYICGGSGDETYQPLFTYHGFRYVQVSGITEAVAGLTLTACLISADLETTGSFSCSDPVINRVHQQMQNSMRSNFMSIPTDCPSRDERTPCQMDSQSTEEAAIYNYNMNSYYRKWLDDISGETGNPDWNGDQIHLAWRLYRYYGDTGPIRKHYSQYKAYVAFLENKSKNLIWTEGFGDWCNPNDNTWPTTSGSVAVVNTCLFYYFTVIMAEFAALFDHAEDEVYFRTLAMRIQTAFLAAYYDPESGQVKTGRQTEQLMPLYVGIMPPEQEQRVADALTARIRSDGAIDTGGYGTMILLPVLAKCGQIDIFDQLMQNSAYPGFGWQIANGATSLWEQWAYEGIMHSHNHVFIAGMDAFFYQILAGITPVRPGFRRFVVRPVLPRLMTFVQSRVQTLSGLIEVTIEKINQGVSTQLTVPPNTSCVLYLPLFDEKADYVLFDGERLLDLTQFETIRASGFAYVSITVGGGFYRYRLVPRSFVYQMPSILIQEDGK